MDLCSFFPCLNFLLNYNRIASETFRYSGPNLRSSLKKAYHSEPFPRPLATCQGPNPWFPIAFKACTHSHPGPGPKLPFQTRPKGALSRFSSSTSSTRKPDGPNRAYAIMQALSRGLCSCMRNQHVTTSYNLSTDVFPYKATDNSSTQQL